MDYQELISARADELRDWLRADEARARTFAEEMRRSVQARGGHHPLGPTLVEDPDSAGLLNLLPDIVDSARAAAQAVAPAAGWLDRRQPFEDSLLEILKNVDEFDRRLPA